MLDNQVKVDESDKSAKPVTTTTTTATDGNTNTMIGNSNTTTSTNNTTTISINNATTISISNNSVSISISRVNNDASNNNNNNVTKNPLDDHDYCSPNKGSIRNESSKKEDQVRMSLDASHSAASTSSLPNSNESQSASILEQADKIINNDKNSSTSNNNNNNNFTTTSPNKTLNVPNAYPKDGELDDSSSSSSSSLSSSKDLVIDSRIKSLAPKDTPSVSRPKLGHVPKLKRDLMAEMDATLPNKHQKERQKPGRPRRPRQNTSVTDKSQWITGDDQIDSALSEHLDESGREKRVRKEKSVDPEFCQLSSSEYSSSEVDSDQDSEEDDENDPNRPWCVCDKPHGGQFMICCDICEYWFHGKCVGITESMSEKFQKSRKEWFCHDCQAQLDGGTDRKAIPRKIPKKEKKSKVSVATGRRRGRPRKSESALAPSKLSPRSTRKSTSSLDSRSSTRRNSAKSNLRSQSFKEFEDNKRLKELIRERKKAFFLKRSLMLQAQQDKMKDLGIGQQSVTAPSFGGSLKTLASSTSTPNMSNLPINIKSEHKERSKPNIVLQINTKRDASSDQSSQRVVTAVVKSKKRKQSESDGNKAGDSFTADPHHISKKSKSKAESKKESKRESKEESKSDSKPLANPEPKLDFKPELKIDIRPEPLDQSKPEHISDQSNPKNISDQSKTPETKAKESEPEPKEVESNPEPSPKTKVESPEVPESEILKERPPHEICWSGTLSMPDIGKFSAKAKPISGDVDFMRELNGKALMVCGRIRPEDVTSYVEKLNATAKNPILLIQLHPSTEEDKSSFEKVFEHLYCRNRCAVINTNSTHLLKDFYICPIHEGKNIPQILRPENALALDRKIPNCLLGVLVQRKKATSANGSLSVSVSNSSTTSITYTPTPINKLTDL